MKNVLCFFLCMGLCFVPAFADTVVDSSVCSESEVEVEVPEYAASESLQDEEQSVLDSATGVEVEDTTNSGNDDGGTVVNVLGEYDADNPLPVVLADTDGDYPSVYSSGDGVVLVIGDEAPENPPFYGAGYITGVSDRLGTITMYFPRNYSSGYFGVDANGYLVNVTSSSVSGYLAGVYNNSVSVPGFAYPRYRNSSGYDYVDIYMTPTDSNMEIFTFVPPSVTIDEVLPYVSILFLGVMLVCFMKRW